MIKEILIKLGVQAEGDGLKKAGQGLDEIGKKSVDAKKGLKSFEEQAQAIPGPMAGIISSVKSTAKSLMSIASANPYLLAIGAAVGIIYSVFKKLDPVVDRIEQVMGGFGAVFENFVESAGKLLSGDWAGFADGVTKSFDAYSEGEQAVAILQDVNNAQSAVTLSATRMEYQIDILIKQSKAHNLGYKDRIALLEKARKIQEQEIELEKAHFQMKLKALALELHARGVTYAQMIEASKGRSSAELGIVNAETIEKIESLQQFGADYLSIQRSNEMKREKINNEFIAIEETRKAKAQAKAEKDRAAAEKKKQDEAKLDFEFYQSLSKKDADEKEKVKAREASLRQSDRDQYAAHIEDLRGIAADEVVAAEERYNAIDELNKKGVLSDQQAAEAKTKIAKAESDAKIQSLEAYGSIIGTIADMVGKETAEGKALAIASSLISTYSAIAKTLSAFAGVPVPGYAIVQAVATGIAGIAAVKKIAETPIPGQGGGGSIGSMPPISAPATRAASSFVMLGNQNPINTRSVGNSKVYVVESDITKTQSKVNGIKAKATIG